MSPTEKSSALMGIEIASFLLVSQPITEISAPVYTDKELTLIMVT
jgi:hypothetical protein